MSHALACWVTVVASVQVRPLLFCFACALMRLVVGGSVRDVASRSAGGGLTSAAWGASLSLSGSMMLGGGRHSGGSWNGSVRDFSATRHSFGGSSGSNYWDRSLISMYEPVSAPQ
jgi:hypothetical protein